MQPLGKELRQYKKQRKGHNLKRKFNLVALINKEKFSFNRFIIHTLCITLLGSCSKKWDHSCETSVYLECNSIGGNYNISNVKLGFADFTISGKRMQGEGFTINSESVLANTTPQISSYSNALFCSFELPQGTYTALDFEFILDRLENNPSLQMNLDYFIENEEEEEDSDTLKLRVEINQKFIIRKAMYDINQNWVADNSYSIYLSLDLDYLLAGITNDLIESAAQEDELIVINETNNTALYNTVYERVLSSFKVRL